MDWMVFVNPMLGAVALALGTWIARRLTTPQSHQRAALLAQIATDAAALVMATNPRATWATLLSETVAKVTAAAGLPVTDRGAIERAAAGALVRLGATTTK